MVSEVNKLIFNSLLDNGAIYIDEIGTLRIERTPSRKMFRGRVASQSFITSFTRSREAISLSETVALVANVSAADAQDIVSRWLKKSRTNDRLTIEGVGIIDNGNFSPDKELVALLERSNAIITLSGKKSSHRVAWVACLIALLLGCGGTSAYFILTNGNNNKLTSSDLVTESTIDNMTKEEPKVEDVAPGPEQDTDTPNPVSEEPEPEPTPAPEVSAEDVLETTESTTPQPEQPQPTVEEEDPAKTEETNSDVQQLAITDWRYASVRHYVIYGSYSVPSNANNAIRKIMRKNPAAQCKIIKLGNMHAVAVYGSYNRHDCEVFKRNHRSLYRNAWIHTPKRFK